MSYRRAIEQLRPVRYPKQDIQEKVQLFLTEADTSAATYAEMAICVAYNKLQGSKTPVEDAGIPEANWAKVNTKIRNTGKAVAKQLGNRGSRLIHAGTSTGTNNYRLGSDTTSKADFVGNGSNQISLKKAGDKGEGAQLMSAKSGEATGVFEAAIAHYQKNDKVNLSKSKDYKNAINILSKQMEKTAKNDLNVEVAKGKVDFANWYVTQSSRKTDLEKIERDKKKVSEFLNLELKALGATRMDKNAMVKLKKLIPKAKLINKTQFNKMKDEYVKDDTYQVGDVKVSAKYLTSVAPEKLENEALKKQIVDVIQTSIDSKPWQDSLTKFFNDNEELKKWMVYEAASGLYKFTGKVSDGKKYKGGVREVANKILVFTDGGVKSEYDVIKYAFANPQLVNKVDVSYKGSGRSKYIKLGISASYEHELPMLREELREIERQYVLNEGIFRDVVNKVKNFYNKVKDIVKRFYEKVIKTFITKLFEIAQQGITNLLDVLGLDISNANVKMDTPDW